VSANVGLAKVHREVLEARGGGEHQYPGRLDVHGEGVRNPARREREAPCGRFENVIADV
jgi:hypothetical protein